jgi:DnaJ-domain-containing protein 1
MSEAIRTARIAETYYTKSYYIYRNLGGQVPSGRDTVQFSKEALDKLSKLKEAQNSEPSQEQPTPADSDLKKSLSILDLGTGANAAQIRKAYLFAISQYHPDKFANSPPEFRRLAEEKTKEINTAYAKLKNYMSPLTSS